MDILTQTLQGRVDLALISLNGDLDGSNYTSLIRVAKDLVQAGARKIILDMGSVRYMSSAGLVALHSIALLLRGQPLTEEENGWKQLHEAAEEGSQPGATNIRLLNLQPRVERTLTIAGMKEYFGVFSSVEEAVASFLTP